MPLPTRPRSLRDRAPLAALLLAALPLSCSPSGDPEPGPRRAAGRPNVLLLSLDTLRADHLSSYGYERATSPRIDALAEGGVRFEDCVSTSSWTLPAHLSMLTGLEVSAHGVCDDRLWDRTGEAVPLRGTFVSEVLQQAGWRTAGFHTWKYVDARFGFGPGFEVYERIGHSVYSHPVHASRLRAMRSAGDEAGIRAWAEAEPELFDPHRPTAGDAVDRALSWLEDWREAPDDRPFFIFLHLFDIHDDYVPPPPFDTLFDPDYDGPIDGRRVASPNGPVHPGMAPRDLEHLVALYDGEIAWVDSQVGRVLDWLDGAGLTEDTLVLLTSDHGEEFFEHGGKLHRRTLERESIHVPLIVRYPGVVPAGRVASAPASIADIPSTVYALLDLPAPQGLSGVDLSAAWRRDEELPERDLVSELVLFEPGRPPTWRVGLHRSGEQLTLEHEGAGLRARSHDLRRDPSGAGPGSRLQADAPSVRGRLEAARTHLAACRAASLPRGERAAPLDDVERTELSMMGYAGGDAPVPEGAAEADRLCLDGCVFGP
jgi:arylsulfatase A-like enzyme